MFSLGKQSSSIRVRDQNHQVPYTRSGNPTGIRASCKGESSCPRVGGRNSSSGVWNMMYYSLDPQFVTLFSVYTNNERLGLSLLPDTFALSVSAPSNSSVLSYAHTVGWQLIALGQHYARLFSQVRTGSVIFLVGVGSLVCWKLWDYWANGDDGDSSEKGADSPPSKSPKERIFRRAKGATKEFLSSFMEEEFVQDIGDLEDEDPALIQQLVDLGWLYIKSIFAGKYFGPESPEEDQGVNVVSPVTSESSPKTRTESTRQYLADRSASYSADEDGGFQTSDFEHDSLPYDDSSSIFATKPHKFLPLQPNGCSRTKKRRRPLRQMERSLSSSPSKSPIHETGRKKECAHDSKQSKRFHPYERNRLAYDDSFSSSETSPRGLPRIESSSILGERSGISSLENRGQKAPGNVSEMLRSEELRRQYRIRELSHQYANYDSDEDWVDGSAQPDGEEELDNHPTRKLSRDISLSDMIGRMRQKSNQRRASLSRDNSVSSRLSDFLKRDDSICSNLSEYAASECSELSLELSYKDDSIANHTITSLADIEDELNTLKSSVIEMDVEFEKYASRPNPYLLKTTFSDNSFDSDSRPSSAMDLVSHYRCRARTRLCSDRECSPDRQLARETESCPGTEVNRRESNHYPSGIQIPSSRKAHFDLSSSAGSNPSNFVTSATLDGMAMDIQRRCAEGLVEEASSGNNRISARSRRRHDSYQRGISSGSLSRSTTLDDALTSLEWDNECLTQYTESVDRDENFDSPSQDREALESIQDMTGLAKGSNKEFRSIQDMEGFEECKKEFRRSKFLPDHPSLELDLEAELQEPLSPGSPVQTFRGREAIASTYSLPMKDSLIDKKESPEMAQNDSLSPGSRSFELTFRKAVPPSFLPLQETNSGTNNPMTASIDSAIHSAPGSRSGSSSPLPQQLTQSMMSSGIATSWSEISTADSENVTPFTWGAIRHGSHDNGCKLKKFWSSEDSGCVEREVALETSVANLSPVHEIRERESLDHLNATAENENIFNNNSCTQIQQQLQQHQQQKVQHREDNSAQAEEINQNRLDNRKMGNTSSSASVRPTDDLQEQTDDYALNDRTLKPIGDKVDISTYAQREWRGNTTRAQRVRNGYLSIPKDLHFRYIRRIRGDNYCGIRAVLYQLLTSGLSVPSGYQVYSRLVSEINSGSTWLKEYSFGRRLQYTKGQEIQGFKDCLDTLDRVALDMISCENKESAFISLLNGDDLLDTRLCESIKLHMMASALDLYKDDLLGANVPLFAMIMYARQTCSNPREFLLNHLNPVGDSAGLEQIEMFLLGYAMRVTLQVVRPSCFGKEDFVCFYPDENIGMWPEVTLVAEDDRHYNVLVK